MTHFGEDEILMTSVNIELVKPGMFGKDVAADSRRVEFDLSNETILTQGIPVDFVFIGDSITHWWDVYAYFGRGNQFIVNRAIAGDNSGYVGKRFEADVLQLKPKNVVIKIGINDFWGLDAWTAADRTELHQVIPEVCNEIHCMIQKSKDQGIRPIVCSILPTNLTSSSNDGLRNEGVRRTNKWLQEMAQREDAIYIDFYSHFATSDGTRLRDELAFDGLHPNIRGYDVMAKILREELSKHGISI